MLVDPGTYVETIDFLGKAIDVVGSQGSALTILDGGTAAPVVTFAQGEGATSRLAGFTVRNGHAASGPGGILAAPGATPTLEDCVVRDNVGTYGAGVAGSPVMRRCVVRDNAAVSSPGGGLFGAPRLSYCIVAGNSCNSGWGGGLFLDGDTVIEDSCVLSNRSFLDGGSGGGVFVAAGANVTLRRCVVADNEASGGALQGRGGGLYSHSSSTVVESCTFVGNRSLGSSAAGGGLWGPATIVNAVVRGNTPSQLAGNALASYSDVQNAYAGTGNFDLDPLFVDVASDHHLRTGSPCVDSGDPALSDPDGSRADVGAFPFATLYTRPNVAPATWSAPSWPEISAQVGGRQVLRKLPDGGDALAPYLTAGSTHGTSPGVVLNGVWVPLNLDRYMRFTFLSPNTAWLSGSAGTLGADGVAETTFTLAPKKPTPGASLHHALLVRAPSGAILRATNAVPLAIVP